MICFGDLAGRNSVNDCLTSISDCKVCVANALYVLYGSRSMLLQCIFLTLIMWLEQMKSNA